MQLDSSVGIGPAMANIPINMPSAGKAGPKDAAKAFEAMFASALIKQMRQTLTPGQGLFGHDPGDVMGGLFDHFMSQHLAQKGHMGIAPVIERQLAKRGTGS